MTRQQLAKFEQDLDTLFKKHNAHPAMVFFQGKEGKIMVLFIGNPSNEWIGKVGDYQMKRFEHFIRTTPGLAPILTRN